MDSMDIAFVLANKPMLNRFSPTPMGLASSIIHPLVENQYDFRLALIEMKPGGASFSPIVHPFTQSIRSFTEWLSTDRARLAPNTSTNDNTICDVLRAAANLEWRTTNPNGFHENIVFLVTADHPCRYLVSPRNAQDDDDPCACDDLRAISDDYLSKNLTLVVVGAGQLVSICEDLYTDIAQNTGGEYIRLTNAAGVLRSVLHSVACQGDTLLQSIRHIKREEFGQNSPSSCSRMPQSKHCQVMAQKGLWLLNHAHLSNAC